MAFAGTYHGIASEGTPLVWSSNSVDKAGYHSLNTYGDDYWLVDLMMDCSKTNNDWFEFKVFMKTSLTGDGGNWENDIYQVTKCNGNVATPTPANIGRNHAGVCGAMNVFEYGHNACEIKRIS